ncbi:hypothetical protein IP84_02480 [beta proteobacterium AAP99]|nr:hypothetical protein IP84_02480 [beta proteobacterium AAP99]
MGRIKHYRYPIYSLDIIEIKTRCQCALYARIDKKLHATLISTNNDIQIICSNSWIDFDFRVINQWNKLAIVKHRQKIILSLQSI